MRRSACFPVAPYLRAFSGRHTLGRGPAGTAAAAAAGGDGMAAPPRVPLVGDLGLARVWGAGVGSSLTACRPAGGRESRGQRMVCVCVCGTMQGEYVGPHYKLGALCKWS